MPAAMSKVDELHQRACALEWGDADAAMALYFQLKAALRGDAANLVTRDALVTTCQIIGYRVEAIENLDILDRSWTLVDPALSLNTQSHLIQLGFVHQAVARARQLMDTLPALRPVHKESLAFTALITADMALMDRLANMGATRAKEYLARARSLPVDLPLAQLQQIALEAAAPYMMGAEVSINDDPETGIPSFNTTILIDGSLIHPSDLFDHIHAAQGSYAANFPNRGIDWWLHCFVDVKAAPRHASIPAKARIRKAA